ncbi:MAG: methyltransferase family protein [Candidatus Thorarchaeota archaeon]
MATQRFRFDGARIIIVILPNILYFVILIIAIGLNWYFNLLIPWQLLPGATLAFPWPLRFSQLFLGTILLIIAIMFIVWGVISLGRLRSQGDEIGINRQTSKLIVTGAYAYCRHPQTLGFIFATPALALMFDFVPLLIVTLIYTPLLLALLGYEEIELLRRFGDSYAKYRETVPFIIPRGKKEIS